MPSTAAPPHPSGGVGRVPAAGACCHWPDQRPLRRHHHRGSAFSLPFHGYLRNYSPEFEEKTGIKIVFDVQAFPIYNQRMDLELSTKGSTYDVCNITFI